MTGPTKIPDWLHELWDGNDYFESENGPMLVWKDGKVCLHIEDDCGDYNWFAKSYPINLPLVKEQVEVMMQILG